MMEPYRGSNALMKSDDGFIVLNSVPGESTTVRLALPKERLLD